MTSSRRILFGLLASTLMAVGLFKAAEVFDPVLAVNRLAPADDGFGPSVASGLS
jgi:hypothetical protein